MSPTQDETPKHAPVSLVLYCLLRRQSPEDGAVRFFLMPKQGYPTFPATKLHPGEDLYSALKRPMEEDLGLSPGSYFPEEELPMIPSEGPSLRYSGLPKRWFLYPVDVSLRPEALDRLRAPAPGSAWWTLREIEDNVQEPNVRAIARYLRDERSDWVRKVRPAPTMDAMACRWAALQDGGVRVVTAEAVREVLAAGDRAFNLRVADPYLAYQRQGLGFTWSFFTPKDKQDVHVHGLPAVEIYGVVEGTLQVWHKPMNQRGARAWRRETLRAGDWAEVEPLHCHFAFWATPEGLGTVFKAAAAGEMTGVGRIGAKGKTVCSEDCSMKGKCTYPPRMLGLMEEQGKPFGERDYVRIASLAAEGVAD